MELGNKFIGDLVDMADAKNTDIENILTEMVQKSYERIVQEQAEQRHTEQYQALRQAS